MSKKKNKGEKRLLDDSLLKEHSELVFTTEETCSAPDVTVLQPLETKGMVKFNDEVIPAPVVYTPPEPVVKTQKPLTIDELFAEDVKPGEYRSRLGTLRYGLGFTDGRSSCTLNYIPSRQVLQIYMTPKHVMDKIPKITLHENGTWTYSAE